MDQHPVPQNISSYEFRLVGDMTLKQFFYVAGGLLVAFIFYKSPFPAILRIPPAIVSALVGILAAFVPVNGRPFSQWLIAFFKAVYSPTIYTWSPNPVSGTPIEPLSIKNSAPSTGGPLDRLESQLLNRFSQFFDQATQLLPKQQSVNPPSPVPPPPTSTPNPAPQITSTLPLSRSSTPETAINPTPVETISRHTLFDSSQVTAPPEIAPAGLISSPAYPNIIAGVVVGRDGKSLEGVIVEIIDNRTNLPVRAFRTNRLGQFQSASSLAPGPYTISAEKDGVVIAPVSLQIDNQLLPPIIMRAAL